MVSRLAALLLFVSSGALLSNSAAGAAGDQLGKQPAAEILEPEEGREVGRLEEMQGRLNRKGGWPVVLVQPLLEGESWYAAIPVTALEEDGAFATRVHFGNAQTPAGMKFRLVVLVAKDREAAGKFRPGMRLKALPPRLPRSEYVTVVRGGQPGQQAKPAPPPRTIRFHGTWEVKRGRWGPGGPTNLWGDSEENVWIDEEGLHLAITQRDDGQFACAEIVGLRPLGRDAFGYGTYTWVVSGDFPNQDPRTVFAVFLYGGGAETDCEISRWAKTRRQQPELFQYVVQPAAKKGNLHRFSMGAARRLTITLKWTKDAVEWSCRQGEEAGEESPASQTWTCPFTAPRPAEVRPRVNLWLFQSKPLTTATRQEVVIHKFSFEPARSGEKRETGEKPEKRLPGDRTSSMVSPTTR